MVILNQVVKNPDNDRYHFKATDAALMADLSIISKEGMHYHAMPLILADSLGVSQTDDTLYAQNLFFKFAGVADTKKIKLGIRESEKTIDFVTLKAYVFPYVNLVWLGLIIMAIGIIMSMIKRAGFTGIKAALILIFVTAGLFYMFLLANQ